MPPPSLKFWFTEEHHPPHVITMQRPRPQLFAFQGWRSNQEPSGPISTSIHSGLYLPDLQALTSRFEDQAKQEGGVHSPAFVFKIIIDVVPLSGSTVTYNFHI